jgi:peptidoglycan/LPS O-acetylase OafA/YrhL
LCCLDTHNAEEGPVAAPVRRDHYFDLLRAIALVRVVTYHTLALYWLHIAFPAIGVMFALGGSLMARSLDRRGAVRVIGARMRRLLPPVWLYAIVALAVGWELLDGSWTRVLFWLLPLRDPFDSPYSSGFVDTLWYLRTYLWFVLLSPLMLYAFRKLPVLVLPLPMIMIPVVALAGHLAERGLISDLLVYSTCWMLGFAEHDGLLAKARLRWTAAGAALVGGLGLALIVISPTAYATEASTVGYALWSAAVVVVLLRWRPRLQWLRSPAVIRVLDVINARAVTIYLWHDAAIVLSLALAAWARLPVVFLLTGVAALLFGWVEDLAAGRRPSLLPSVSPRPTTSSRPETAPAEAELQPPQRVRASQSR